MAEFKNYLSNNRLYYRSMNRTDSTLFSIIETRGYLPEAMVAKPLFKVNQIDNMVVRVESVFDFRQYTPQKLEEDIVTLQEEYKDKFRPNDKNVAILKEKILNTRGSIQKRLIESLNKETNFIKHVFANVKSSGIPLNLILWEATSIIANNGKHHITPNAPVRWGNILKKLNYKAIMIEDTCYILDNTACTIIKKFDKKS